MVVIFLADLRGDGIINLDHGDLLAVDLDLRLPLIDGLHWKLAHFIPPEGPEIDFGLPLQGELGKAVLRINVEGLAPQLNLFGYPLAS